MIYNRFYFIYSLTNSQNQKRYIGYTNDLNRRLFDHLTQLELGQHPNKKLQEDYKEEYFEIEVLATYVNKDNDYIAEKEKDFIKRYNSFIEGYNQTSGGEKQGQKNNSQQLLDACFILQHYENSGVVVQKLFNMSESAVLRLKNGGAHIHILQIVKTMSSDNIAKMKEQVERDYNISEEVKVHRDTVTLKARGLDRATVLQIIAVTNNRQRMGGKIERHLGMANQHTSRIKRGLRYREYYDEYIKMSDQDKNLWLESGLKRFNIE